MSSLAEVVELFESKIGHEPKSVNQLFNFCKMENLSFKYSVINKWWKQSKSKTNDNPESQNTDDTMIERKKKKKSKNINF